MICFFEKRKHICNIFLYVSNIINTYYKFTILYIIHASARQPQLSDFKVAGL